MHPDVRNCMGTASSCFPGAAGSCSPHSLRLCSTPNHAEGVEACGSVRPVNAKETMPMRFKQVTIASSLPAGPPSRIPLGNLLINSAEVIGHETRESATDSSHRALSMPVMLPENPLG